MTLPLRGVHLDFHTLPSVPAIGKDFDAEAFVRTLKKAHVDYINIFARCNLGFSYYPTKVGTMHPNLDFDLLGSMTQACLHEGIGTVAYFNAGLDHEHALLHREWCKVDREGAVYDLKEKGHFFRKLCLNTGYAEHLLAMISEVINAYPVDGLFLDCFHFSPCYGHECLHGMSACGMDPLNEEHVRSFAKHTNRAFQKKVTALIETSGRDLRLCCNGLPFRWQTTHTELEVLPTGGWGYDVLPWQIRYVRTLGKPYSTMTGRFHGGWGDFGGLRTEDSLLFDCLYSIANGGACVIGDHLHPYGRLETPVYDLVKKVYQRTMALDNYVIDSGVVVEAAIVEPRLSEYPGNLFDFSSVAGAARMLSELKLQFDIVDGIGGLENYKIIILPDSVEIDTDLENKLAVHIAKGGIVISSGSSGIDKKEHKFILADNCMEYLETLDHDARFFTTGPEISEDIPNMPLTIYSGHAVAMAPKTSGKQLATMRTSFFKKASWDGFHEHLYTPPDESTATAAVIEGGNVVHIGFELFSGYYEHAYTAYKYLFRNVLARVYEKPLVRVSGLPSFAQVTIAQRGSLFLLHVTTYLPELRGKSAQVIEEPIRVQDVRISLLVSNGPWKAYLAPGGEALTVEQDNDYLAIEIPVIAGYQLVVVEPAPQLAEG